MSTILQSIPSPMKIREELEQMVVNDLLGPAGGPDEELVERNVRDRYLVGVLAPRRKAGDQGQPPTAEAEAEEDTPLIPDELSEGGADSTDDGNTDLGVPVPRANMPSSFGLTFCVGGTTEKLKVSVHWGQYLRERKEDEVDEKTGRAKLIWKRHPRGGVVEIALKNGRVGPLFPDAENEEVYIQGVARKRDTHWIVTLFLVNGQEEPKQKKDETFLFQPELIVEAVDGAAIFEKKLKGRDMSDDLERATMEMLYRRQIEFAVGHGVGVRAEVSKDSCERATQVRTNVVPTHEVPITTPPTASDAEQNPAFALLDGLVLDMKELAEATAKQVRNRLQPLLTAYKAWIDAEEAKISDPTDGLAQYEEAAKAAIANCRTTHQRIETGLKLIEQDKQAAEAFSFMNRAMWLQRTHSIYAEQVRRGGQPNFDKDIDKPDNRRWYPFQIAFVLLNLPAVTKLDHPDRSESPDALADLLFFPTGGGKTEAYLGLTAYVMGLRRLQGTVAGRAGENGVAVLMRYTLRLLDDSTIPAGQGADVRLRTYPPWGLGKRQQPLGPDAISHRPLGWKKNDAQQDRRQRGGHPAVAWQPIRRHGRVGSPYQLTNCPWCGSRIEPGRHLDAKPYTEGPCRTWIYCGDMSGNCPFSRRLAPDEGLPVMVVDEEIYRRLPSAAHRHGGQVRPNALERGRADALRAGQRPLLPPRVPLARNPGQRFSPSDQDGPAARDDPAMSAASAAGPYHSGRIAPHQRAAGDFGGPVRNGHRQALHLGSQRQEGPARR